MSTTLPTREQGITRHALTLTDDRGLPALRVLVTIEATGYSDTSALVSGGQWPHYRYAVTVSHRRAPRAIHAHPGDTVLRRLSTSYSAGVGITARATAVDVMTSLVQDWLMSTRADSWKGFALEFGYDVDSISARRGYKALKRHEKAMSRVFTDDDLTLLELVLDQLDEDARDERVIVEAGR